ncbi:hypothetical protein NHQ30_005468 [Ciborinia camelliae]|nr:hypothetical protein NHQ30_005468 [Ciborinia camelliae]
MNYETTQNSANTSRSATPDQETVGKLFTTSRHEQNQSTGIETGFESDGVSEYASQQTDLRPSSDLLLHGIPAALSNEISELLTEDQLVSMQSLFRAHLTSSVRNSKIPTKRCHLLKTMPIECRKQIWEYLLYNPLLGECFATDNKRAKFGLFPTVLRVNKQIYNEGMDILYGCNTFLVDCTPHRIFHFAKGSVNFCALTRYQLLGRVDRSTRCEYGIIPAAKYVQHWKVVLSAIEPNTNRDKGLLSFSRNTYMANIKSLEVLIVPRGIEPGWNVEDIYGDENQLTVTLSPLERLRNVKRFTIRQAEFHEIPQIAYIRENKFADELIPILPSPVDQVRLVTLIEGNSKVEIVEEMYKSLLTYAQTFERIKNFKVDMDIDSEEIEHGIMYEDSTRFPLWNPFKWTKHPVEATLSAAKVSMMKNKMEELKHNRSVLLRYLEPHYQSIEAASRNLVDFIKLHKQKGGLLDPNAASFTDSLDSVIAEPMVLLEDYAASFTRKLEPPTKIAIRRQKLALNICYESLPREKFMKLCETAYEKGWWGSFMNNFKEVVDDMDTQYLAIREARKKLYAWDLDSTVREIDIKPMLCDEMINWDVCEADMRINEEDREYRDYPQNYEISAQSDDTASLNDEDNYHENNYQEGSMGDATESDGMRMSSPVTIQMRKGRTERVKCQMRQFKH